MSDKSSKLSDFSRRVMAYTAEATRAEMQDHVRRIAGIAPSDSRKAAIAFAARVIGLPCGRVRSLFYGEARRIEAHEADRIRAYVEAAHKLIEAQGDYERQRREFLQAHQALARLAPGPLPHDEVSPRPAPAQPKVNR